MGFVCPSSYVTPPLPPGLQRCLPLVIFDYHSQSSLSDNFASYSFVDNASRKWLTTPMRKLSQGKFDRSSPSSPGQTHPSLPPKRDSLPHRSHKSFIERKTSKFSSFKVRTLPPLIWLIYHSPDGMAPVIACVLALILKQPVPLLPVLSTPNLTTVTLSTTFIRSLKYVFSNRFRFVLYRNLAYFMTIATNVPCRARGHESGLFHSPQTLC